MVNGILLKLFIINFKNCGIELVLYKLLFNFREINFYIRSLFNFGENYLII